MAPQRSIPAGRPNAVATKLSDDEAAYLDRARGSMTRAMYLRLLLLNDRKRRE